MRSGSSCNCLSVGALRADEPGAQHVRAIAAYASNRHRPRVISSPQPASHSGHVRAAVVVDWTSRGRPWPRRSSWVRRDSVREVAAGRRRAGPGGRSGPSSFFAAPTSLWPSGYCKTGGGSSIRSPADAAATLPRAPRRRRSGRAPCLAPTALPRTAVGGGEHGRSASTARRPWTALRGLGRPADRPSSCRCDRWPT